MNDTNKALGFLVLLNKGSLRCGPLRKNIVALYIDVFLIVDMYRKEKHYFFHWISLNMHFFAGLISAAKCVFLSLDSWYQLSAVGICATASSFFLRNASSIAISYHLSHDYPMYVASPRTLVPAGIWFLSSFLDSYWVQWHLLIDIGVLVLDAACDRSHWRIFTRKIRVHYVNMLNCDSLSNLFELSLLEDPLHKRSLYTECNFSI